MKLGTVIAFCTGAAVVVAGQHWIERDGRSAPKHQKRAEVGDSYQALALLKTTSDDDSSPQVLTESQQAQPEVKAALAPPAETTPPTEVPPLPEGHGATDSAGSAETSTDSWHASDNELALDAHLSGLSLPSVSPKVTGEFQLPQADVCPLSDPIADAQRVSPGATLPLMADTETSGQNRGGDDDRQDESAPKPTVSLVRDLTETSAEKKPVESSLHFPTSQTELAAAPAEASEPVVKSEPVAQSKPDAKSAPGAPPVEAQSQVGSAAHMDALKTKIRRVLDHHRHRMLNTRDHGAWETMHSFIAYGVDKQLQIGGPSGQKVNAIGWICFNGPCAGERLFTIGSAGPQGRTGPGLQGHEGQFLAMLAQSRVEPTYPMKVDGRDYTVQDLVRQEQATCRPNSELTFKLIGLMHYLKSDDTWKDTNGGEWNIPRLIREELAQPIIGATCGGTHRLFGLTYAYKKRQQRGEPVTGQYRRAQVYIKDFQDYTFKLQNPDGSFSTAFFAGQGNTPDPQRRLETTGHIAEWLTFSLEDQQLRDPRMIKAIDYLATLLDSQPNRQWKVGPLGHALHALNMYDSYVFGGTAYPRPTEVASATSRSGMADQATTRAPAESSIPGTATTPAP